MSRNLIGGLILLLLAGTAASSSANDLVGSGAIGGRLGTSIFTQDPDTRSVARPRLAGDVVFSYVWQDRITADITAGYGYNKLESGNDLYYLAVSEPLFTLTGRYFLKDGKGWRPYIGAGGGAYVWSVLNYDLSVAIDPQTTRRLHGMVPGLHGMLGVERRMSKRIGMTGDVVYHYLFSEKRGDFPSGYGGNKAYLQFRAGVSFYFSLSERVDTGLPE